VSYYNGFQHDLKAVCDLAHAHGAHVYADIIQAAGAGLILGRAETLMHRIRERPLPVLHRFELHCRNIAQSHYY
jgi:hypothetical protein